MSLTVNCDECGYPVEGNVHARTIMRVTGGELRLVSETLHYHRNCLLAWAMRTAVQEKVTTPLTLVP